MKEPRIYPREKYLKALRPFYDSDIVKVITGIRRCGKSTLLKSVMKELLGQGVKEEQILYLPLDRRGFHSIRTPEALEERIESMIREEGFHYLFIDEVQNVVGFERIVLAYQEEGYSIFLTGSNSYLLSEEISTKLTGRYLNFETYPLDFKEYLEMKSFFGQPRKETLEEEFDEYLRQGGFPKALEFSDGDVKQIYTKGIIEEIIAKDVKTRKRISNIDAFLKTLDFVIGNYASPIRPVSIASALNEGGIATKASTVRKYLDDLCAAKILYECKRFDVKTKKALKENSKYYLADLSLHFSLNTDNSFNYGPSLENILYLYFRSNGYRVSVGRIGKFECDFILRDPKGNYAYVQIAYSLQGESLEATSKIKEREYRPFTYLKDGYPRYLITLDRYRDQQDGVKHLNAIDLLLGKVNLF